MKPCQFEALAPTGKAKYILNHGVEVAKRVYKNFDIHLYQFDSFYVEVFCHSKSWDFYAIRAFDNILMLDPYLLDINIKDLYSSIHTSDNQSSGLAH